MLSVSLYNFIQPAGKDYIEAAINLMEYLFWKDDQFLNFVRLTPMIPYNDGTETPTETYHVNYDTDKTYMNLRFGGPLVNECLMEWHEKMQEVKEKKLTDKEYREWKYTWPESSKYRSEHLEKITNL